ncbi:ribose-phosphate pyrophosphokinase [Patescibacteria group bacterium]|nr:ribose-phosphate pyrophosphokinase [Patescibacteria group bacterium]MBU1885373.1 ribose-phosphate pyrophosphokinase [Patescibacteria group bacterium]
MKLISGSSNLPLAQSLAKLLEIDLIKVRMSKYLNDEKHIEILNNIQGENIILVQSFSRPVDEHIMEFLLLTDALERMGARHVNVVIPWYGYSLQDKVFKEGEPLSAKVVANLVSASYIKRVFLLDVHNTSIAGFFSVPTHHLSVLPLFAEYAKNNYDLSQTVVASPDFGGLKRAGQLAKSLNVDWVNIDKQRNLETGKITKMELHGDVKNKTVLVFDDVSISGGTVAEASEILKNNGAKEVHFLVTHGLFAGNAKSKLNTPAIDTIVVTNSIYHQQLPDNIRVIDCAKLFADQLKDWM